MAADRDDVAKLAKVDNNRALALARDVEDGWYRCQSLAYVARYAPDGMHEKIASEAIASGKRGKDGYQVVAASAWPIRALIERGAIESAQRALPALLTVAEQIPHEGNRAEALSLLFQAAAPGGKLLWKPVADLLFARTAAPVHWRHRRAMVNVVAMLRIVDKKSAESYALRVDDRDTQRQLNREAEGKLLRPFVPRSFFCD